ncbi:MAG: hypothetical protein ACK5X6_04900 [Chryseotalea sp.]
MGIKSESPGGPGLSVGLSCSDLTIQLVQSRRGLKIKVVKIKSVIFHNLVALSRALSVKNPNIIKKYFQYACTFGFENGCYA